MIKFSGFSTVDVGDDSDYKLYDIELIKRDLLNHFHTRLGERVMRPTFGSIIWDLLMEPMNEAVIDEMRRDALRICESDSRVKVESVNVVSDENHSVMIVIELTYVPFDITEVFVVNFNERESNIGMN